MFVFWFKCDDVTIKLAALEQNSACLNPEKNKEGRKGASVVLHTCSKL
jgi:hypothetical protein